MPALAAVPSLERAFSLVRRATFVEQDTFTPSDRRTHRRLTLSELSWLKRVRLKYGPVVSLIDFSAGGAQIETTARFQPGSTVVIEIAGQLAEFTIPATVLRCQVSGLVPHTVYRGALLFKRPFELPGSTRGRQPDADDNPAHECARLSLALKRSAESNHAGLGSARSGAAKAWIDALATVLGMIESVSGRRAGAPYRREMSRLLRTVIRCVESGATAEVFSAEITERVRRSVPVLTLRVVDTGEAFKNRGAAGFDISATPQRPAATLLVELPLGCRLDEWHQEFLKAAAQLIAVTQGIETTRQSEPEPAPDVNRSKSLAAPPGWNRLVVRYADGRMMKGYGRNFTPSKGQIDVWSVPDGPSGTRITVPLTHLKAAFFVHDLDGLPAEVGPSPFDTDVRAGRRIVVTFLDGEVLSGTTLNYSPGSPGFFMVPADDKTNNLQVFVVSGSIRHVQFP